MIKERVQEAKKLGFTACIVPFVCKDSLKEVTGIKVLYAKNVGDRITYL